MNFPNLGVISPTPIGISKFRCLSPFSFFLRCVYQFLGVQIFTHSSSSLFVFVRVCESVYFSLFPSSPFGLCTYLILYFCICLSPILFQYGSLVFSHSSSFKYQNRSRIHSGA